METEEEQVKYLRRIALLKERCPWLKEYIITNDEYDRFWHIACFASICFGTPPFEFLETVRKHIQEGLRAMTRHELYMTYHWMRKDTQRDAYVAALLNVKFEEAKAKGLQ